MEAHTLGHASSQPAAASWCPALHAAPTAHLALHAANLDLAAGAQELILTHTQEDTATHAPGQRAHT